MNYAKIIGNVISLPKNRMCRLSLHSLFALVLLAIGAFIYLMFRSPNLVIFKWCESLGFLDYVMKYRDQFVVDCIIRYTYSCYNTKRRQKYAVILEFYSTIHRNII